MLNHKDLKVLEKRYLFLKRRILENMDRDLSHDKKEASVLKRVLEELSPKYNFKTEIISAFQSGI